MNIEDLTLTKGDNCSIISKAAKKHTASERRLPVVTSENAARKVPTKYMEMPKF